MPEKPLPQKPAVGDSPTRKDSSTQNKVQAGFGFALACLGVVGIVSYLAVDRLREDAALVEHTREVIDRIDSLDAETTDAQNGDRGYAVTGDESYLEPYLQAVRSVPAALRQLRRLTADNPGQQQRLETLAPLIDEELAFGREIVDARRNQGFEAARTLLLTRKGKTLHDQTRSLIEEMKRTEETLLAARKVRTTRSAAVAQTVIVVGSVMAFGLVGLALFAIRRDFAGRRRAEHALRRSEESLSVTLHSIGDAVVATDTAGKITRMNRVAEELTGWTRVEAEGVRIEEVFRIINETTRAPAVVPVSDVLATGKIHGLANHTVLVARDGTERAIADSAAPIRGPDDRLLGVVLVFRDVTAERAAEVKLAAALEELATERARLKFIFDTVPIGITFVVAEPDGRRTRVINDAHLRICALTRDQVDEPGAFVRITHPDDREAQAQWLRQLQEGTIDHYAMDKRYVRPDGQIVWIMLSCQRRRYADGGYEDLSIVVDITERKQAEEKIDRQNAQLRAVFESLPGSYLVLRPDLTIVTATEAYLQATMTRREAIVGRGLFEVFPDNPDDAAASGVSNLRASLDRVRQHQIPDTMAIQKYDVRRPDGTFEERYWSPINSPVLGVDRTIEYIIHRVEDVTDFVRQKQARRAETNSALKARMEQMEAEVFQSSQKVQLANRQLEAANAELEAFSYSVSHDLRAPLRHVQGFAGLLAREAEAQLSDEARRYLKTIVNAAREMGVLIDDLLSFSKMGRIEMHEDTVDLAGLIDAVRHDLESASPDRNRRWKIASLPVAQGDPVMLKQVFANLLGNAVKYSRGRDPAEIEVGCAGAEGGRMVVFVRDNGTGFDMKYAGKLFGVFQRLHRAEEFEGTGVGLAIVQRIVVRHGGRIWAEATPDVGATFYFTLQPAAREPAPANAAR